jgi:purine-nucleoside phosphorylase
MSIHISAAKGSIAPTVLMPGDPLRAKLIADNYLDNAELVSATRNMFYYTGTYKGKSITVGASGMGCASIGIYSFELYNEYDVQHIIRVGTCGAYTTDLKLYDILNVSLAASESTFALAAFGIEGNSMAPQGNTYERIQQTADTFTHPVTSCAVHSSDYFYRNFEYIPAVAQQHHCLAVEMEAFALFSNAKYLGKNAACLLTVSDIIPTHERITAEAREQSLIPMMELALETALHL